MDHTDPRYLAFLRNFAASPTYASSMEKTTQLIQPKSPACDACGCRGVAHMVCSKCRSARYCGAACQRAHWVTHKIICTAAQATPAVGNLDVRRFQKKLPGTPLVLRGDRLFSVFWDMLDVSRGPPSWPQSSIGPSFPAYAASCNCHPSGRDGDGRIGGRGYAHQRPRICITGYGLNSQARTPRAGVDGVRL